MAEIKDKIVTVESLAALHEHNKTSYMSNVDPIASGSFSLNRKEGSNIGANSVSLGNNTIASGMYSYAEGANATTSAGYASHAEGSGTIAKGMNQHVQGKYNIEDTNDKYAHIIGNGSNDGNRSNAHTVDWDGNAWYAGDISVNGDIILTSGQYGDTLPAAGIKGRIFFKKLSE